MSDSILRDYFSSNVVAVSNSAMTPTLIGMNQFSGGTLHFSAIGNSAVTVYFFASTAVAGVDAAYALCDSSGTQVTRVLNLTSSRAIPIPDECFGCSRIGMYASVAGVMMVYTLKG